MGKTVQETDLPEKKPGIPSSQYFQDFANLQKVLSNSEYSWRSETKILEETGWTKDYFEKFVQKAHERGVISFPSKTSESGETLYAYIFHLIIRALENPEYGWRTLNGIATETGQDTKIVQGILSELEDKGEVVKTTKKGTDNVIVYTTRKHYEETHNFLQLSLSAITNNIIY